jgi:tRNA nucleotidyltransferase/poly(A) polymerase
MNNTFIVEAVRSILGETYLVGGTVRDTLMGKPIGKDLDFATPLPPEQVKKRLEENGYKVNDIGIKFGTVTTIINKVEVEITSFRSEAYKEGDRSPVVEFGGTIEDDLSRRDFTINSIAHDGDDYIDPFDGTTDIVKERIKTVGDPVLRFSEDPLRILRAIRFVSELGFYIESETFEAIVNKAEKVGDVSSERIAKELNLMLTGEYWFRAVSLIVDTNLLDILFGLSLKEEEKTYCLENIRDFSENDHKAALKKKWVVLITAILKATHKDGARTLSSASTIFRAIKNRLKWSQAFSEELYDMFISSIQKHELSDLRAEYSELERGTSSLKFIVKEKILKLEALEQLGEGVVGSLEKTGRQMLEVKHKNIQIRILTGIAREVAYKESQPYVWRAFQYMCMPTIFKFGYIENTEKLNKLYMKIASSDIFKQSHFNTTQKDRYVIAEDAFKTVSARFPGRLTSLTKSDMILGNDLLVLTADRLEEAKIYLMKERDNLLKSQDASMMSKSNLSRKLARVSKLLAGDKNSKDFLKNTIERYKWETLAATKIEKFWASFEKMNTVMDEYIDLLERTEKKLPYAVKDANSGFYLDNAQCLSFAVTLEPILKEKAGMVRSVISNYQLAGSYYKKKSNRFQLLYDWYFLADEFMANAKNTSGKLALLEFCSIMLEKIRRTKSYNYIDVDEDYFVNSLKDLNEVRNNLLEFETFLASITSNTRPGPVMSKQVVGSLMHLYTEDLVDVGLAIEVYKLILIKQINLTADINPLTLLEGSKDRPAKVSDVTQQNIDLITKGENQSVEFKASWRYNLEKKEVDNRIKKSAIRAVISLLNTDGGVLFVGVDDTGEIAGLEVSDFKLTAGKNVGSLQQQDKLSRDILSSLEKIVGPNITAKLIRLEFDTYKDRTYIAIRVNKSPKEIYFENDLIIRIGASTKVLQGAEIANYVREMHQLQ